MLATIELITLRDRARRRRRDRGPVGLVKDFGATRAVAGVSFTVRRGEIMGLLGPNGSGKTTIMRVLTGFFPPTEGRVAIDGLDVEEQPLAVR